MKRLLFILFLIPIIAFAQEKGIQFEHNTDWQKVKAKAKAENKYIFVDCFTTWCGPCIWMAQNIFPQEKVGEFFNKNFVNLKIQMDQTAKDNDEVKSWYTEAKRFESDYSVQAYPTFLVFNPDGELVHRIVGGGEADDFIAKVQMGLNSETQYVTLLKKFKANPNDPEIAKKTAKAAMIAYDEVNADLAIGSFVQNISVDQALSIDNFPLIISATTSMKSPSYELIRDNMEKVDVLLVEMKSPSTANEFLGTIIMNEVFVPKVFDPTVESVDFAQLQSNLEKDYPYVDMSAMIAQGKSQYYMYKKDWPNFKDAVNAFVNSGSKRISPQMLNSFAWAVFENCDDAACLKAALAWSKKSIEPEDNAAYLDTYANLLHKSGNTKTAIIWAEKALNAAAEADKVNYQETLDKIKAGKPTWN